MTLPTPLLLSPLVWGRGSAASWPRGAESLAPPNQTATIHVCQHHPLGRRTGHLGAPHDIQRLAPPSSSPPASSSTSVSRRQPPWSCAPRPPCAGTALSVSPPSQEPPTHRCVPNVSGEGRPESQRRAWLTTWAPAFLLGPNGPQLSKGSCVLLLFCRPHFPLPLLSSPPPPLQ